MGAISVRVTVEQWTVNVQRGYVDRRSYCLLRLRWMDRWMDYVKLWSWKRSLSFQESILLVYQQGRQCCCHRGGYRMRSQCCCKQNDLTKWACPLETTVTCGLSLHSDLLPPKPAPEPEGCGEYQAYCTRVWWDNATGKPRAYMSDARRTSFSWLV